MIVPSHQLRLHKVVEHLVAEAAQTVLGEKISALLMRSHSSEASELLELQRYRLLEASDLVAMRRYCLFEASQLLELQRCCLLEASELLEL